MANLSEYVELAKKLPSNRTAAEQAMVDRGSNIQEVRNADFDARMHERKFGK